MFNPFFLAQPIVLTKHCLVLVRNLFWIYSKVLLYFPKCTNPRSYDLVLLHSLLIYTLILTLELNNNSLTSDKSFPRIPRVQNPVMPHPWMHLHTSHGCRVGTGKPTNLEVATRYIFLVKPLLNCTQHSAVKWRISYHSKETRVSQSHRVIYNIQPWIINVDMCYSDLYQQYSLEDGNLANDDPSVPTTLQHLRC